VALAKHSTAESNQAQSDYWGRDWLCVVVSGISSGAQQEYAEHRIATFPIGSDKRPSITNYQRVGLPGSANLAARFGNASGLGFMTNARNRIAVLDVDSTDERIFADALNRYGDTPVKVQTGSGKFHGLYRFNGERRRIRPFGEVPIDILGTGGFVIAPPSVTEKGTYRFIEGGLDDLDRLPIMRGLTTDVYDRPPRFDTPAVTEGKRSDDLWRQCMREAKRVDSFDALLNVARTLNKACSPPLDEREIVKIAQSAWNYEERGLNRFGQHGAWLPANEYDELLPQPDGLIVLGLLAHLRRHQGPLAEFWCTNSLAEKLGCSEKRLARARRRLIDLGYIKQISRAGRGTPARFRWPPTKGRSCD
jgi:Bifunctional DNA primase/polymerase, N-terminal/Primase C terminal 1 (PriCT-1)